MGKVILLPEAAISLLLSARGAARYARGEEPGMRPVVKKNACGIWVKNALYARGEEFLPLAGMERKMAADAVFAA